METTTAIALPDPTPLRADGVAILERAKAITITDDESYQGAALELHRVANLRKSIEMAFADSKRKAHEAHKAITKLEADLLQFPKLAESTVRQKIGTYDLEQERIRRAREAELAAEQKRRDEERALAEAEALERSGQHEEADQVLSEAVAAPPPVVELPRPTAPGIATRRRFNFRIVNASAIKRPFLTPDETRIRKQVEAVGFDAAQIVGGIEVYEERVTVRSGRY